MWKGRHQSVIVSTLDLSLEGAAMMFVSVLYFTARCFNLKVPLSTQEYKYPNINMHILHTVLEAFP